MIASEIAKWQLNLPNSIHGRRAPLIGGKGRRLQSETYYIYIKCIVPNTRILYIGIYGQKMYGGHLRTECMHIYGLLVALLMLLSKLHNTVHAESDNTKSNLPLIKILCHILHYTHVIRQRTSTDNTSSAYIYKKQQLVTMTLAGKLGMSVCPILDHQ